MHKSPISPRTHRYHYCQRGHEYGVQLSYIYV